MRKVCMLVVLALFSLMTLGANFFRLRQGEYNPGEKVVCDSYAVSVVRVQKEGITPFFMLVRHGSGNGTFFDPRYFGGVYGERYVGFESLDDLDASLAAVDAFVGKASKWEKEPVSGQPYYWTEDKTKDNERRVGYDPHTGREAEFMCSYACSSLAIKVREIVVSSAGQKRQNERDVLRGLGTFFGKGTLSLNEIKTIVAAAHSACQNFRDGKTLNAQCEQERVAQDRAMRKKKIAEEKTVRDVAEAKKLRMAAIKLDCTTNYERRVEAYWTNMVEHNYNLILAALAEVGEKYCERGFWGNLINPYGDRGKAGLDIWIEPRLNLSDEEKTRGTALLEEFGIRFMPNAYSNYEKAKEKAQTVQLTFNENFPKPWEVKSDDSEWPAFCKLLRGFCRVRGKYFRTHDELAHFYMMHKVGAITTDELAEIDKGKIVLRLLEKRYNVKFPVLQPKEMTNKIREFGTKYASESYAVYTKLESFRGESEKQYAEAMAESRLMDVVRFELPLIALCEKLNFVTESMDKILFEIKSLQMDYDTEEKEAEEIAKADHALALHWKPFLELLPKYVADRANGPLIPVNATMNAFYPNTELRLWNWYALGFPGVSSSENGFEKYFYFYRSMLRIGGDLDGLPAVDCVDDDDFLQQAVNNEEEMDYGLYMSQIARSRSKFVFIPEMEFVENVEKLCTPVLSFIPLKNNFQTQREDIKSGFSMTETSEWMSINMVTTKFVKFNVDESAEFAGIRVRGGDYEKKVWSAVYWGRQNLDKGVVVPSPFERRLNEFNKGKCYCEIKVEVAKDEKGDERGEGYWWRVVTE